MPKIVFINMPSTGIDIVYRNKSQHTEALHPPLGVVYLASAVKREFVGDAEVSCLDFNVFREEYAGFSSIDDYKCFICRGLSNAPNQ